MRLSASEKYEIIQMVDQSEIGVNKTLKEIGVNKSTFFKWYKAYCEKGMDGLQANKRGSFNSLFQKGKESISKNPNWKIGFWKEKCTHSKRKQITIVLSILERSKGEIKPKSF